MPDNNAVLALVSRWAEYYNDDVTRMVDECYAPDCQVEAMGMAKIDGQRALQKVEDAVLAKAPKRRLEIRQVHVAGTVATVECDLLNPDSGADWRLPFVAVLTVRDGRVVSDHTYADWSRWPGW